MTSKKKEKKSHFISVEPMPRVELGTFSLPRKRSTPELYRQKKLSGRRGSNSRHSAWKADALPTELLPLIMWGEQDSNLRRRSQQFYRLLSLTAWVSPQIQNFKEPMEGLEPTTCWLQISCSSQLSYIGLIQNWLQNKCFFCLSQSKKK